MKTLESPDYAEYIGTILSNQKVIAWLKEQVLGKEEKKEEKDEKKSDKK